MIYYTNQLSNKMKKNLKHVLEQNKREREREKKEIHTKNNVPIKFEQKKTQIEN